MASGTKESVEVMTTIPFKTVQNSLGTLTCLGISCSQLGDYWYSSDLNAYKDLNVNSLGAHLQSLSASEFFKGFFSHPTLAAFPSLMQTVVLFLLSPTPSCPQFFPSDSFFYYFYAYDEYLDTVFFYMISYFLLRQGAISKSKLLYK